MISSVPEALKGFASFIGESTRPQITPSGLDALDGGHGEAEPFGQSALVEAQERSGGPLPAAVIMFVTSVLYVAPGN